MTRGGGRTAQRLRTLEASELDYNVLWKRALSPSR